jgi:hypothetical protein
MSFATTVSSAGRIPTVLPTNQRTPLQPWAGSPSSGVVVIQSCFCAALEAVPCPCSFQSHNSTVSLTWQGNSTSNEKLLKKLDDLEKPLTDFREWSQVSASSWPLGLNAFSYSCVYERPGTKPPRTRSLEWSAHHLRTMHPDDGLIAQKSDLAAGLHSLEG